MSRGQARSRHALRVLANGLAAATLVTVTCSSPTLPSTTTIIPPPGITCPVAPAATTSSNGLSVVLSYAAPTVTGGTEPVSASCAPPSGSSFTVGSTTVTCTATDAVHRTSSCSFAVSVLLPPPRLSVTNFLAFGDSITAGEIPDCSDTPCVMALQPTLGYPAQLHTMLSQRYTLQTFTVTPDGVQGESAVQGMGRLDGQLLLNHPDVLLLLEGVNDLDPLNPSSSMQSALNALQTMIQDAHGRGVRVIISTLLPEVQVAGPGNRAGAASLIPTFNSQLVPMALSQGALVVDMYSEFFNGDLGEWISPLDGEHPTAAGYQEMARVWLNSIQSAFEVPSSATTTSDQVSHTAIRGGSKR